MKDSSKSSTLGRRDFLKRLGIGTTLSALPRFARAGGASAVATKRPSNVIFILADDIGYGDLGCYGATKVKTPNLDRLAAGGVRFTDAHSPSSMCTPTRVAVLTGEYAWRGACPRGVLNGDAALIIKPGSTTVPSLLKKAGYATGAVGKWHLGFGEKEKGPDYNGELKPGPLEVGFDYFFGYPATNDRVPCVYVENHRVVNLDPKDPISFSTKMPEGKRIELAGHPRIGTMTGGKAALWKDEDMAAVFSGKAISFIEAHRDQPFFLYYCPRNIHVPITPNPRFRGTSQCGIRGDDIHELDWAVGELLKAVDRLDLAGNTLVIFTSDNGGTLQFVTDEENAGHKLNGDLRGNKGGLYEGGHREPFIARWPERIKSGQVSKQMICLIDLLATCAALTGTDLPAEAGPDSLNVLPALLDPLLAKPVRKDLVMHSGAGALAIREGDWKLIPKQDGGGKAQKTKQQATGRRPAGDELYNLADDLGEQNNVYAQHPEIVKHLTELLEKYRSAGRSRGT